MELCTFLSIFKRNFFKVRGALENLGGDGITDYVYVEYEVKTMGGNKWDAPSEGYPKLFCPLQAKTERTPLLYILSKLYN